MSHAGKCYCMAPLRPDGTCRYGCAPEANPKLLRAQSVARRKKNERAEGMFTGAGLPTQREVREAMARVAHPTEMKLQSQWRRPRRGASRKMKASR